MPMPPTMTEKAASATQTRMAIDIDYRRLADLTAKESGLNTKTFKEKMLPFRKKALRGLPTQDKGRLAKQFKSIDDEVLRNMAAGVEEAVQIEEQSIALNTLGELNEGLQTSPFMPGDDGLIMAQSLEKSAQAAQARGYITEEKANDYTEKAMIGAAVSVAFNNMNDQLENGTDLADLNTQGATPEDTAILQIAKMGVVDYVNKDDMEEAMAEDEWRQESNAYAMQLVGGLLTGEVSYDEMHDIWDRGVEAGLLPDEVSLPSRFAIEDAPPPEFTMHAEAPLYNKIAEGSLDIVEVVENVGSITGDHAKILAKVASMPILSSDPTFQEYAGRLMMDFKDKDNMGFQPHNRFFSNMIKRASAPGFDIATPQQKREIVHAAYLDAKKASEEAYNTGEMQVKRFEEAVNNGVITPELVEEAAQFLMLYPDDLEVPQEAWSMEKPFDDEDMYSVPNAAGRRYIRAWEKQQ